jgi:serine/threonine-protein kinase
MATCPACRKRYPDHVTACEVDGETLLPNEAFTGVDVDLSPGQVVGEYRIEAKIGEGGFGAVYKAVHPLIGKTAAIKVLNRQYSANPQMVSRFIAEARAVNQIRHRNIIDIFAFGALEDGRQYFIMELLEGLPLDKYLGEKTQLSVEEAVGVLRPVARALDAAHAAGIAHRDLKPENIFLSFDEEGQPFPKLLDFGIAKLLTADATQGGQSAKTRTGTPMGTPYYMSPEQCRGKNVDQRTDIYSFGIMLHQVLSGKLPFDGDDLMDLLLKQTTAPAPPLSSVAQLPNVLDPPLLAMMEKDPAKRPQTVGAAMDSFVAAAKSAGFGVTLGGAARKMQSGPSPAITPMTPSLAHEIGQAKTMATPGHMHTFQGANVDVRPPQKKRTVLYVVAPLALVIGAVGGFAILRQTKTVAKPDTVNTATPVVSTPAAPATSVPIVPTVAAPAEVMVTVQAQPEHATIWLGDQKLGDAPGPVKVGRGDAKVKLAIKAPGYLPQDIEVTPNENTVVSVKLVRKVVSSSSGTTHKNSSSGEIEDPFK